MRRLLCLSLVIMAASSAQAGSLDGRWDATVTIHGNEIPFQVEFSGDGRNFTGTLFDGDLKVTSTGGELENGAFVVNFGHYLTRLTATPKDGELRQGRGPVRARQVHQLLSLPCPAASSGDRGGRIDSGD